MDHFSLLETISQVAATFAGFAAVIVGFGSSAMWEKRQAIGLIHFLQISLGVVLLALIPGALTTSDVTADYSWQISNGVLGVYHIFLISWMSLKTQFKDDAHLAPVGNVWIAGLTVVGVSSSIANLAVAVGYLAPYSLLVFFFGLLWLLGMSLVNFVAIVLGDIRTGS